MNNCNSIKNNDNNIIASFKVSSNFAVEEIYKFISLSKPIITKRIDDNYTLINLSFNFNNNEKYLLNSLLNKLSPILALKKAKLIDIYIPQTLLKKFSKPINTESKIYNKNRPLVNFVMKDMLGITAEKYSEIIEELMLNGVDITCDSNSILLNRREWELRTKLCAIAVKSVAAKLLDTIHMVNVNAKTESEILFRANYAIEQGFNYLSIDSSVIDLLALEKLIKFAHSKGAFVAVMGIKYTQQNNMSEQVLAKILRLAGCDIINISSSINNGVKTSERKYIKGVLSTLRETEIKDNAETNLIFNQYLGGLNPVIPTFNSKLNICSYHRMIDTIGLNSIIQCTDNILSHSEGYTQGAIANRIAIETLSRAKNNGINIAVHGKNILEETAIDCEALNIALNSNKNDNLFKLIVNDNYNTANNN